MSRGMEVSFPAVSGIGKGPFLTASSLSCSAPLPVAEGCRHARSTASSRAGLPRVACCGRSLQCCGPVTPTSVQLLPREVKDPATRKSVSCCIQLRSFCPTLGGAFHITVDMRSPPERCARYTHPGQSLMVVSSSWCQGWCEEALGKASQERALSQPSCLRQVSLYQEE